MCMHMCLYVYTSVHTHTPYEFFKVRIKEHTQLSWEQSLMRTCFGCVNRVFVFFVFFFGATCIVGSFAVGFHNLSECGLEEATFHVSQNILKP